jgi:hypothetical protein
MQHDYFLIASRLETECESRTDLELPKFGKKVPDCLKNFGELLQDLDAISSCYWGCNGGDHRLEYITGKLVASARAGYRLLRAGFYDDSLALARSIGEAANLLFMFAQIPAEYHRWSTIDDTQRRKDFSPIKVRLLLEQKGIPIPIDQHRYSDLSEVAVHLSPNSRPNSHHLDQRPASGGHFNLVNAVASLNEVSAATAISGFSLAQLITGLSPEHKKQVMLAARALLQSVGALNLSTVRDGSAFEHQIHRTH